jgi:uncharacterized membrane protein YqjE
MGPEPEKSAGLVASARRLLTTVLAIVTNRLELLAVEAREEAHRWVTVFLLAAALAVMGTLAVVMISLTIVVACWEEHRLAALVGLSVFYLLAALIVAWKLQWGLQHRSAFSATIGELRKDKASLEVSSNENASTAQKDTDFGK